MSNLLRKIWNIFGSLKPKEKSTRKTFVVHANLDDWYRSKEKNLFDYCSVFKISLSHDLMHVYRPEEGGHFHRMKNERLCDAHELDVYEQYIQKSITEDWLDIMRVEDTITNKMRYAQKLEDLDRRMIAVEQERVADKQVQFGHTRELEYIAADVEVLKKEKKALMAQEAEVEFDEDLQALLKNVEVMEEMCDEPVEFEQARATFIGQLRSLEGRKQAREPYFADLLTILDVGIKYVDGTELTENSFSVLRSAVRSISCEVTSDTLSELRKQFRNNGINILRPLDPNVSIDELLTEMFK